MKVYRPVVPDFRPINMTRSGKPLGGTWSRTDTLAQAQTLQSKGRLAEAETLYRQVLKSHPDAVPALEGLGVLVFQQGRAGEAATLFERAVAQQAAIGAVARQPR